MIIGVIPLLIPLPPVINGLDVRQLLYFVYSMLFIYRLSLHHFFIVAYYSVLGTPAQIVIFTREWLQIPCTVYDCMY